MQMCIHIFIFQHLIPLIRDDSFSTFHHRAHMLVRWLLLWWINSSRAVHSQRVHAQSPMRNQVPPTPFCRRTWHGLTEMHRHYPFTAHCANAKKEAAIGANAHKKKKRPCYFFPPHSLWFVNTSVAVQQLPDLYLITIKHLHEKVDKGWNCGGESATKGSFYSVQSRRDARREGRRRSWEESWINELKMSCCLNAFGFI